MRKGQYALEFLMTYGWAILVVLVLVGALAYFGVINPSRLIPDKCIFEPGILCRDFTLTNVGTNTLRVQFLLENKGGDAMLVNNFNVTTYRGTTAYNNNTCGVTTPFTWSMDQAVAFDCTFNGASAGKGQTAKLNVWLNYTTARGMFPRETTGQVQADIQ